MAGHNRLKGFLSKHFSLTHIAVSFVSQKLFNNNTYTIRHGLAKGMKRKGGLGFLPITPIETAEIRFLRNLPLEGKVVYDVGAFEGLLTLFFASKAKYVFSYEPNPRNYARCIENVQLNHLTNVRILNHGVSDRPGTIDMVYDPLMPGAASGEAAIAAQIGESVKSIARLRIPVVRLDDDIAEKGLPAPDMIKIDVEGMELQALQGMQQTLREHSPALHIEMHGANLKEKTENSIAVVGLLDQCGYTIYDVEHDDVLSSATLGDRRPSHLYCTKA